MEKQPAIKSYFFGKGFLDLKKTIKSSWQANLEEAIKNFDQFEFEFQGAFRAGVGISMIVFGSLFFGIVSLFHVILLFSVATVIYLCFSVIWLSDRLYRAYHKIFTACPHSECFHHFDIPRYHCPNCGIAHSRLHPGPYGILSRTCQCGHRLPQTFLNGRKKLTASCPECKRPIDAQESRPIVLPIIGAPSVGKTCFVTSMVYSLKEEMVVAQEMDFSFTDQPSELAYISNLNAFAEGGVPLKTVATQPTAINMFITPVKNTTRRMLYLFDPAGEAYLDTTNTQLHRFNEYFHGAFFLIDPFAIPSVQRAYADRVDLEQVKPSQEMLEDVFDRVIINLEKNFGLKPNKQIKQPFAIVLTKVDVGDLEQEIGATAARLILAENDEKITSLEAATHEACIRFLRKHGMEHVLNKFAAKFKSYRFFSASSLGQESTYVKETAAWLLKKVDRKLTFAEEELLLPDLAKQAEANPLSR